MSATHTFKKGSKVSFTTSGRGTSFTRTGVFKETSGTRAVVTAEDGKEYKPYLSQVKAA